MTKKLTISERSKIAIVYRPDTDVARKTALQLVQWLKKNDFLPLTAPDQKPLPGAPLVKQSRSLKECSLLIALGGDGTYLRAVRILKGLPIPILGVNLGSLGFLTPLRLENFFKLLPQILCGSAGVMVARSQMLVQLKKLGSRAPIREWQSLNDVVIERGPSSQLIDLQLKIEETRVSSIKADALVIATPTGSTAYNLAAGGPILHPETLSFVVTPVAPHSLTSRPLIFPDSKELQIELHGKGKFANLVIDGQMCQEIANGQVLKIKKHPASHWMVQIPDSNFYDLLREKLSFGERD